MANCQAEGLKVCLRFTINKRNVGEIPGIFRLLADLEVPRACFYHLVYSGRGSELIKEDLDHAETRQVLDLIMDETRALFDAGKPKESLTVDNHADGPYLWMRMKREDPKRAEEVFELLQYNEGNNSGRGIGCISWDGKVHADQFWRNHTFGNVLERPFSQIWDDPSIELLHKLKDKKAHVGGRCAKCRFLNICGGNFRARAEAYYGDEWAQDSRDDDAPASQDAGAFLQQHRKGRLPAGMPAITALPGGFSPVAFCAMVAFTPEGPVPCRPAASGRRPFRAPVLPAAPPGRGRAAAILPKHNRGIAASR